MTTETNRTLSEDSVKISGINCRAVQPQKFADHHELPCGDTIIRNATGFIRSDTTVEVRA